MAGAYIIIPCRYRKGFKKTEIIEIQKDRKGASQWRLSLPMPELPPATVFKDYPRNVYYKYNNM